MKFTEEVCIFTVAGEQLLGIVARPETSGDCGVLIIVGGPQYRVGSHRQFLLLSRRLAAAGHVTMRFDYRGMGDSTGVMRSFEDVCEDVGAAIDAMLLACPTIKRVVLWGLCDAASVALLYLHASNDARVAGLVLLNPWVRSETSLAQTHIKHYYGQRLLQKQFWLKLLRGELKLLDSMRGLLRSARQARGRTIKAAGEALAFQEKMAAGLGHFTGHVLLILSGQDFTAKEFQEFVAASPPWAGLTTAGNIYQIMILDADHTFSNQQLRTRVEYETLSLISRFDKNLPVS
ncbi:MAG: hydrolase 1, exosortase A system-associated [Propionivibrio sp.]